MCTHTYYICVVGVCLCFFLWSYPLVLVTCYAFVLKEVISFVLNFIFLQMIMIINMTLLLWLMKSLALMSPIVIALSSYQLSSLLSSLSFYIMFLFLYNWRWAVQQCSLITDSSCTSLYTTYFNKHTNTPHNS